MRSHVYAQVFIYGLGPLEKSFLLAAKNEDWDIPAVVASSEKLEYVSSTIPWHVGAAVNEDNESHDVEFFGPPSAYWDTAFQKLWHELPSYHAASTFAMGLALVHAIEECGCTDSKGLIETMRSTRIKTMYGPVRFDANGQNEGVYHVQQAIKAKVAHDLELPHALAHDPEEEAFTMLPASKLVYPMPSWKSKVWSKERCSVGQAGRWDNVTGSLLCTNCTLGYANPTPSDADGAECAACLPGTRHFMPTSNHP